MKEKPTISSRQHLIQCLLTQIKQFAYPYQTLGLIEPSQAYGMSKAHALAVVAIYFLEQAPLLSLETLFPNHKEYQLLYKQLTAIKQNPTLMERLKRANVAQHVTDFNLSTELTQEIQKNLLTPKKAAVFFDFDGVINQPRLPKGTTFEYTNSDLRLPIQVPLYPYYLISLNILSEAGIACLPGSQRVGYNEKENEALKNQMYAAFNHFFSPSRNFLTEADGNIIGNIDQNQQKKRDKNVFLDRHSKVLPGLAKENIFLIDDRITYAKPTIKAGYQFIHCHNPQEDAPLYEHLKPLLTLLTLPYINTETLPQQIDSTIAKIQQDKTLPTDGIQWDSIAQNLKTNIKKFITEKTNFATSPLSNTDLLLSSDIEVAAHIKNMIHHINFYYLLEEPQKRMLEQEISYLHKIPDIFLEQAREIYQKASLTNQEKQKELSLHKESINLVDINILREFTGTKELTQFLKHQKEISTMIKSLAPPKPRSKSYTEPRKKTTTTPLSNSWSTLFGNITFSSWQQQTDPSETHHNTTGNSNNPPPGT